MTKALLILVVGWVMGMGMMAAINVAKLDKAVAHNYEARIEMMKEAN